MGGRKVSGWPRKLGRLAERYGEVVTFRGLRFGESFGIVAGDVCRLDKQHDMQLCTAVLVTLMVQSLFDFSDKRDTHSWSVLLSHQG